MSTRGLVHPLSSGRSVLTVRWASGWLGGLLGKIKGSPVQPQTEDHQPQEEFREKGESTDEPEDALKKIAEKHLPEAARNGPSWKEAELGDADLKSKILCSFESTFKRDISSKELASINTFADLQKILNTAQRQDSFSIYPNFKDDDSLPPNLSVQFINTAPRPKPDRKPFQNYDARRPEHANFLTKAQKEKRKQKRRHLTAWK